jgi:ERCC4-related helicase
MTTLRGYQQRAVELGKEQSLIVVLPTGSGKTLIAATIAAHHARKGSAVLFLVPTCLLVQQQARAMRDETGLVVVEYMSGAETPPINRRFHVPSFPSTHHHHHPMAGFAMTPSLVLCSMRYTML